MLYAALAFFIVSLATLALGFLGFVRGAAGFVTVSLLAALILLAVGSVTDRWHRQIRH